MKLSDHVEVIRKLILKSFDNEFGRLGLGQTKLLAEERIPNQLQEKRKRILSLINSHKLNNQDYSSARETALEELTFTLFNRFAAIKVMEAHQLFPPVLTKEAAHGDRSFGHKIWLEDHPEQRREEIEGLRKYIIYEFDKLGETIPLYHKDYPYAFLPNTIDLNNTIDAFNQVEKDQQIEDEIWQSDDILGWLYESYNNEKKQAHKDSNAKTEYHKVSLQSQVYTPRWVVEFLVHNALGKLYLEMYPDSEIRHKYKIANAPQKRVREPKRLKDIKLIDPASGSGNFVLYGFEFFYQLYLDQIENYGAGYDEDNIPKLIIENNLYGVDLDDRAIQLAQLGLWIKAKQKQRNIGELKFNLVSSAFSLPNFDVVQHIFENKNLDANQQSIIQDLWEDLQNAHKFGSLVRLEEKLSLKLHGSLEKWNRQQIRLFDEETLANYEAFEKEFFTNLETAVAQYATQQGNSFLTDKTKDAITFLRIITQRYDVATANPPYTDSADFGPDLKKFIEANYKKPYKFHTNLYATFIKRCFELTNEQGKVAMVHPPTFMYIKTFEDVRKYMLEKSHIDLFVEWGYLGMFHPSARVDAAMYVLDKQAKDGDSTFIKLNHIYEGRRYESFVDAYDNLITNNQHSNNYSLPQSKLKIIKSYPFIYWISDEFREKFELQTVDDALNVKRGCETNNNNRFLKFWWEVPQNNVSKSIDDEKDYYLYAKGGPFNKWAGNLWITVDFRNESYDFINENGNLTSEEFYYKKGITYSASGSKGPSFRILPENSVFDVGGSSIFPKKFTNVEVYLAFFNSKLTFYLINCLNPTVNTQIWDIKRLPFVAPKKNDELLLENLVSINVGIKNTFDTYALVNPFYNSSPLAFKELSEIKQSIKSYFDYENFLTAQVLINEAIINEKIFQIYELTDADKAMVLAKEGESIGALPVSTAAKAAYLANEVAEFPLDNIREYIKNLPEQEFEASTREAIENEFPQLYQSNNDLEEFCIRHQINPINVWYWFKEANVIPKQRMNDLAMEFLADLLREILMEDDDGIIPLVPNAGEKVLLDRIEEKFMEKGFSMAQYSSFDSVLGRELNEYINNHFFKNFSDHLNLFMYLPKTPFIWHLTSGPEQGFDCYIIIYKWNRDKLLSIRSRYIEQRERSLENRQSDLRAKSTLSASEQNELDKIYKQLKEIESFKQKIDELLAEGYNPILDDGVGKNIAPLQNKKMIAYEVLNAGQLKKYLNADW